MPRAAVSRSEEHTSELQSPCNLVCRLLLEKKKKEAEPDDVGCVTREATDETRCALSCHCFRSPQCLSTGSISCRLIVFVVFFFFFNDTATTEIYTLSLHDALPI